MDIFKQKHIVEGLTMLIEETLDEARKSEGETVAKKLDLAENIYDIAKTLDYFPREALEKLSISYNETLPQYPTLGHRLKMQVK